MGNVTGASRTAALHLSPLAGREPAPDLIRGRLASGALAQRSKSGEGALPQARTRGDAPSPGFRRFARNPTSPRQRGEVEQAAPPARPLRGLRLCTAAIQSPPHQTPD